MSRDRNKPTRRGLFQLGARALATLGAAGTIGKLTEQQAAAQRRPLSSGADHILVAIYLVGGNDSNNMVVPLDSGQYSSYAQARGSLAIDAGDLLEVTSSRSQQRFGFHPALHGLRDLFTAKNLAVVSNVGVLERPANKSAGLTGSIIPRGFGHHTDHSMGYLPGGYMVPGWTVRAAGLSASGPNSHAVTLDAGLSVIYPDTAPSANLVRREMLGVRLRTPFPATVIGGQLQQAARLIHFGSHSGLGRQMFTAVLGGFDTHVDQTPQQNQLFASLDTALTAFYESTVEMGLAEKVTTFTLSEFNRTLQRNSKNGTDHGWGGHQLVMGGSVAGGDVYGTFPSLNLGGPDDLGNSGIWIPSTSRDQYEATLANWFGANTADLADYFPSLTAFSKSTLEFMA